MPQPDFIWQRPDWPRFAVREAEIASLLEDARLAQGRLTGKAHALGLPAVGNAAGEIWAAEALATASIEGEKLDPDAVRSSVARRLGLPALAKARHARDVEGLLDMMEDAVARHASPFRRSVCLHGRPRSFRPDDPASSRSGPGGGGPAASRCRS